MVDKVRVPPIDFTSRDFLSLRSDMISLIPFFTPDWTDHNASDMGIVLLDCVAYAGDILHYYVDRMAAESYFDTAVTPEAVMALARAIDYTPSGPIPAVVTLTLTVPTAATAAADYTIPAGTKVSTGVVIFETDEDLLLPVGTVTGTVTATQGITIGEAAPDGEALGTSDGLPFQFYGLAEIPPVAATIAVYVDESASGVYTLWSRVTTLVDQDPDARVYVLRRLTDRSVVVSFGDGTTGKIPPAGAVIQAAYRIGGGESGNVGSGTITTILSALPGGYVATVNNEEAAEGGSSGETITEVKQAAPRALRALHRAVTLEDYAALALTVSGVQAAKARWVDTSQKVEVAVASGSGLVTSAIKADVLELLDNSDAAGLEVTMFDPTLVSIDMTGTVVTKAAASRATVEDLINDALSEYFAIGGLEGQSGFGTDAYESDIVATIDNLDGIDHLDLVKLTRKATLDETNWVVTGDVVTVVVGQGNKTEQSITITLPVDITLGSDVEYTVEGSATGPESLTGTAVFDDGTGNNGVAFSLSAENTEVSVTIVFPTLASIQAGTAIAPQTGDQLVIKVGKYRGNQTMSDFEIRRQGTVAFSVTGGTA